MSKMYNLTLWVARLLGGLLVGMVIFLFIGELFAPQNFEPFTLTQSFQMAAFITMNIGLVVAYWKEFIGGSIAFGAHVLFAALEYIQTQQLAMTWTFALYLTLSFAYIVIGWYRRRNLTVSEQA